MRFRIRYTPWLLPLFWVLGMGPGRSIVELDERELRVKMGWAFEARIPREAIRRWRRARLAWYAIGVHGDFAF